MKALFIKGTTLSGKIVNEGETHEVPPDTFRLFKLAGQAVEAPEDKPAEIIPAPPVVAEEPAAPSPRKQFKRRR